MRLLIMAILLSACGVKITPHDTFFDPYLRNIEDKVFENTGKIINMKHSVVFYDIENPGVVGLCLMKNWAFEPLAVIDTVAYNDKEEDEKEYFLFYILVHESLGHCHGNISTHRLDIVAFEGTGIQIGQKRFGNKYKIMQYPAMPGSIMWPFQMNHKEVYNRADWYIKEMYNPGYNEDVVARLSVPSDEYAMDLQNVFIYEVYDLNNNKVFTSLGIHGLIVFLSQ